MFLSFSPCSSLFVSFRPFVFLIEHSPFVYNLLVPFAFLVGHSSNPSFVITNLDLVECNIHSSHCFTFSGQFHYPAVLPFSSAPSPMLIISFAPYVAERYMAPPTSGPSFYSLIALAERGGCGRFCVVRSRHREQGRRRRRHGRWDRDGESGRTGREEGKGRCFGVVIKSHTGRYWASWYVPAGPPGPPSH